MDDILSPPPAHLKSKILKLPLSYSARLIAFWGTFSPSFLTACVIR